MPRSVQGKTAIVTGAGSGINLEFARVLLEKGANVLIGDLTLRPEAQKLVDEYASSSGPKAIFHKTDVSSWSHLSILFQLAKDEFGTFDTVCPGAGIFEPPFSGFWYPPGSDGSMDHPYQYRYKSIDVNLTVVHVCSIASEMVVPMVPLYAATKWGLRGFIYSLGALEEMHYIRVAGVAPATIRTPLWLEIDDKKAWASTDGEIQNNWVSHEEVARVMYQICTEDDISNTKGETISVKGGSLIEVVHEDVRDVPIYGAEPPATGTDKKGLFVANTGAGLLHMNAAIKEIQAAGSRL